MSMLSPWVRDPYMRDPFSTANPFALLDQHFGLGLLNEDLLGCVAPSITAPYTRPWRHLTGRHSGTSNIIMDKDQFRVNLDVQQFRPDEVNVKVVDNFVIIEGNHEERTDEHGYISRSFRRRYMIPKGVNEEAIQSTLSSDGVLTISAPTKKALGMNEEGERMIPITQTLKPAAIMSSGQKQEQQPAINGTESECKK